MTNLRAISGAEGRTVSLTLKQWQLGNTHMRIHRPKIRSVLTALKDCEPPLTCETAHILPCVGRTLPVESGI